MRLLRPNIEKLSARRDGAGLIKALGFRRDDEVRAAAAAALGALGDRDAIDPLATATDDPSAIVRYQAAAALVELGDPRAFEPLVALARDRFEDVRPDDFATGMQLAEVRARSAAQLGRLRDARAVPALLEVLETEPPRLLPAGGFDSLPNPGVVYALGEIGDARAVEPLVALLKQAAYATAAAPLATALEQLGSAAVEPLLAVLREGSEPSIGVAADVLLKLGWRPTDGTDRALYAVARGDWQAAAKEGHAAVEPLRAALMRGLDEPADALASVGGPAAADALVAAIGPEPGARQDALFVRHVGDALGRMNYEDVVGPLAKAVGVQAVVAAADIISRSRERLGISFLWQSAAAMAGTRDWDRLEDVAESALRTLVDVGDAPAIGALFSLAGWDADQARLGVSWRRTFADVFGALTTRSENHGARGVVMIGEISRDIEPSAVQAVMELHLEWFEQTVPYLLACRDRASGAVREAAKAALAATMPVLREYGSRNPDGVGDHPEHALKLLLKAEDLDDGVADALAERVPDMRAVCEGEDTSHGGFTNWQLYGGWVTAGELFLRQYELAKARR